MLKRILAFGACMLVLPFIAQSANASVIPTEKFSYVVNFEEKDPVQFWAGSKDYTVNFKGLTDEKSVEGKKCFKLDVTFGADSYICWNIPMSSPVPAEGSLAFTGNVFLGEGTTASKVEVMLSYAYPPSPVSGTCLPMYNVVAKEKWLPMQGDLAKLGKGIPLGVWAWGDPDVSNTGIYLTDMLLRIYGKKGDRLIVYLDDFKIEGEIPVAVEYSKEATKRWAPVKERIDKKISAWESNLSRIAKDIEIVTPATATAVQAKKETLVKISALKERIEGIKARHGAMAVKEAQEIDASIKHLEESKNNLLTLAYLSSTDNLKLAVTSVSPISSIPRLPSGLYGKVGNSIAVTAAQGEYEPASFVVHAMRDIKGLTVKVGNLTQGEKVIPASNIDMKVVKCWYQAGTAWYDVNQDKSKKVLVPELLLNDDTLVKVDAEKEENYLKLGLSDGERYIWISNPNETAESVKKSRSVKEFPVKDSPVLLPVDIPANTNKQFWITVKVPEDAMPGTYSGKIQLVSADGDKTDLNLSLKVLPFKLPKPYYDSTIFYIGCLDPAGIGSISAVKKSKAQLAAELADMVSHGIDKPVFYQGFSDKELLKEHLAMRQAAGISNDPLYYYGFWMDVWNAPALPSEGKLDFWKFIGMDKYREFLDFASKNGIKEVYFYGIDEAKGDALVEQRDNWAEIRKLGGKVFVAGYRGSNFPKMGDIQDLLVCAYYPHREEAALWHSVHHKIWCYANPQGGVENPEVYRRNFGLLLWQSGYDGACTFTYMYGFGNIWNDFDDATYRDHVFAYPTVDGVIGTIAWEGYREGVDDVRYMTLLQQLITSAEKSKNKGLVNIARQAKGYLKTIDADNDDLNDVRSNIVDYILKLK